MRRSYTRAPEAARGPRWRRARGARPFDGGRSSATSSTSVIDLARSLGVSVVAEGVETQAQLAGLRARGCDTMQGFLFARPGPAEAVASLMAQRIAA